MKFYWRKIIIWNLCELRFEMSLLTPGITSWYSVWLSSSTPNKKKRTHWGYWGWTQDCIWFLLWSLHFVLWEIWQPAQIEIKIWIFEIIFFPKCAKTSRKSDFWWGEGGGWSNPKVGKVDFLFFFNETFPYWYITSQYKQ